MRFRDVIKEIKQLDWVRVVLCSDGTHYFVFSKDISEDGWTILSKIENIINKNKTRCNPTVYGNNVLLKTKGVSNE